MDASGVGFVTLAGYSQFLSVTAVAILMSVSAVRFPRALPHVLVGVCASAVFSCVYAVSVGSATVGAPVFLYGAAATFTEMSTFPLSLSVWHVWSTGSGCLYESRKVHLGSISFDLRVPVLALFAVAGSQAYLGTAYCAVRASCYIGDDLSRALNG